MAMQAPGLMELIILLGLAGGGAGLPLGIPPAAEDPLLAKVAPDQCLFYTTWSGVAEADPNSSNQTEQLLAEPEVQHLIGEVKRRIKTSLRDATHIDRPDERQVLEDAVRWVEKLLSSPTAIFISSVKPPPQPDVRGAALVRVDEDAAELKAKLEQYQMLFLGGAAQQVQIGEDTFYRVKPDASAPTITWGVKKSYFLVGVGEGSIEGILERARTPAPQWLVDLRKRLPVDRTATVTYVNLKSILDTAIPMAPPEARKIINALGLDNVAALSAVSGLDKEGFVNRCLLGLDGEPRGLLGVIPAKPLRAEDLAPIPSDATVALAARIQPEKILDGLLSVMGQAEPRAREEFLEELAEAEAELGFRLREDVLAALGDAWCVYSSPAEGGLVITGLTAVVPVKDRERLARAHERFLGVVRHEMGREPGDRRGPRIEQFKFAGQDVYFFNARTEGFPLAPAWCLTDEALVVAVMPQQIKAYLLRGEEHRSLAAAPAVGGPLRAEPGPVLLSYVDTHKIFELVYPFVPMIAQAAMSQMQREGIDVDVSILPSARAIGKHLRPTITALRRTDAGIELISRQTVPGGNLGTAMPMAVGLLAPAFVSARSAAQRARSLNNLKMIGLAMHNYHQVHGTFPPAYSVDEQGKPLLSWRVHILPYLEQEPLYDRFHLDEPWDSPHNRPLIDAMPQVYRCPGANGAGEVTHYVTLRGEQTVFPGKEKIRMADIRDGTSNTIMVVEAARPVPWTKPDDLQYNQDRPTEGLIGIRPGGFSAAFCDGSVRFIRESVDPDEIRAKVTRDRGETVN